MFLRAPIKIFLFFLLLQIPVGVISANDDNKDNLNFNNIRWSKLTYYTAFLFIPLSSEIYFDTVDTKEVLPVLINSDKGAGLKPKNPVTGKMTMLSDNLGRKSRIDLWFDNDLTAIQRIQLDTGKRNRHKTFRFLENGVYSIEKTPLKSENRLPFQKWTNNSENFYPITTQDKKYIISDDSTLFYAVSASNLNKPGDKFQYVSFGKEFNYLVSLVVQEETYVGAYYTEQKQSNKRFIDKEIDVLRISVTAKPTTPGNTNDFEFLGLKKGLDLYMEPKNRIIVRLSGKVDYLGRIDINLDHVILH